MRILCFGDDMRRLLVHFYTFHDDRVSAQKTGAMDPIKSSETTAADSREGQPQCMISTHTRTVIAIGLESLDLKKDGQRRCRKREISACTETGRATKFSVSRCLGCPFLDRDDMAILEDE
jgi:hypothetical protein